MTGKGHIISKTQFDELQNLRIYAILLLYHHLKREEDPMKNLFIFLTLFGFFQPTMRGAN